MSRPVLAAGLVGATAALLIGTAATETSTTVEIRNYEQELIDGGFATLFVEQDNPLGNTLDAPSCDELGSIDGVAAVMGLREPEPWTLWAPGGPPVPVREVSGDVIGFFRQAKATRIESWQTAQMLIDLESYAASPSGGEYPLTFVGPRSQEPFSATALTIRLTALGSGSSGNIITVGASQGPVSACALFVATEHRAYVTESVAVAMPIVEGFSQRWALASAERFGTPRQRFVRRPSQHYWAVAAICFVGIALLYLRLRRSDLALYAVAGLRTGRVWFLATVELLVVLALAATIAGVSAVLLSRLHNLNPDDARVGLTSAVRAVLAMSLTSAIVAWATARRTTTSALDALKDR